MRTLHVGQRVSDLQRSLAFYGTRTAAGLNSVQWSAGHAYGITKADLT